MAMKGYIYMYMYI